MTHYP